MQIASNWTHHQQPLCARALGGSDALNRFELKRIYHPRLSSSAPKLNASLFLAVDKSHSWLGRFSPPLAAKLPKLGSPRVGVCVCVYVI